MTLRDFILKGIGEIEVWDANVDIRAPYYVDGRDNGGYVWNGDDEEEHNLYLLEMWVQSLELERHYKNACAVDVYSHIEKNWDKLMNNYYNEDEEGIADCTEDVFTTLSQGYYATARMFVEALGLEKEEE